MSLYDTCLAAEGTNQPALPSAARSLKLAVVSPVANTEISSIAEDEKLAGDGDRPSASDAETFYAEIFSIADDDELDEDNDTLLAAADHGIPAERADIPSATDHYWTSDADDIEPSADEDGSDVQALPAPGIGRVSNSAIADEITPLPTAHRATKKKTSAYRGRPGASRGANRGAARGSFSRAHSSRPPPHHRLAGMERPAPSWDYLRKASEAPELLGTPRGLLVILDTNGTLLSRQKAKGRSSLIPRPGVARFLDYLLKRHKVMIWSSAGLGTVNTICHQLLLPKQIRRLVAIWSRDDLGMTPEQYRSKGPIFKRLSRVWQDSDIQQHRAVATQAWSQQNTVLIDNTPDKAASEPYNNIAIRTFAGGNSEAEDDLFGPVIEYLDMLRSQRNVSAYIRHACASVRSGEALSNACRSMCGSGGAGEAVSAAE